MNSLSADSRRAKAHLVFLRVIVYFILIFLTVLCLFSFYMLIINATRSNGQLQGGFTLLPGGHFIDNLRNAWTDASINIPRGMLNSFLIAAVTAVLTTYFSALTAYGIYAYDFKLKKLAFTFILAVMVIPSQVSAAGFVQICYKFGLTNNYLMLILPGIARAHLLRACEALGVPYREHWFTLDQLFDADEVIVTSSSHLCLRAERIDGQEVGFRDDATYERLRTWLLDEFYTATEA